MPSTTRHPQAPTGKAAPKSPSAAPRAFLWLLVATCLTTYALIIVGGIVRTTGSGDACPDWPTCHGQLLPPLSGHVLIEFSHRLLASVVGLLVLAVALAAWRSQRRVPVVFWGALLALALVVVQVVLGGVTVLSDLHSGMVMAHLATASALLATLLVVTVAALGARAGTAGGASFRNLAAVAALAVLALMLSGSYVSGSGAGLAFRDWPLFDGRLMPEGGRLAMIHATHRFAALLVGLGLAHVTAKAWRTQRANRPLLIGTTLALALYVAQAFVGAANVWTLLQPAASAAHLALAMAIWAILVVVATLAHLAGRPAALDVPLKAAAAPGATAAVPGATIPARGRS